MKKLSIKMHSFKAKLIGFCVVLYGMLLIVMALSSSISIRSHDVTNNYSTQYEMLSTFYKEVDTANVLAQNFLYSQKEEDLNNYITHYTKSRKSLKTIVSLTSNAERTWRIGLLDNMILTYNETFEKLRSGERLNGSDYEFMVHTAANISDTATQYYNMITQGMSESSGNIQHDWARQMPVIYGLIILTLVFTIGYTAWSIHSLTVPMGQLIGNIKRFKEGQYEFTKVKTKNEELTLLVDAFSDMAVSVKGYVESIRQNARLKTELLKKENENLKISELLTKTELMALQGQMNPHFLFNTLSMLSKMAYIENAPETSKMMEIVADLMRYSLDKSSKSTTMLEELKCLKNYYLIQEKRFGQRVRFSLNLSDNLRNIVMPSMILQPLVENAIIHGFGQMPANAKVTVSVYEDKDFIYISVSDNGVGMESSLVETILSEGKVQSSSGDGSSIGLNNVIRRLRMFFGEHFSLNIESGPGCGTLIVITLPISIEGVRDKP